MPLQNYQLVYIMRHDSHGLQFKLHRQFLHFVQVLLISTMLSTCWGCPPLPNLQGEQIGVIESSVEQSSVPCVYKFTMGTKNALLEYYCGPRAGNILYKVSEDIGQEKYNVQAFVLEEYCRYDLPGRKGHERPHQEHKQPFSNKQQSSHKNQQPYSESQHPHQEHKRPPPQQHKGPPHQQHKGSPDSENKHSQPNNWANFTTTSKIYLSLSLAFDPHQNATTSPTPTLIHTSFSIEKFQTVSYYALTFTLLSLAILPPQTNYLEYMRGMNIFSVIISVLLSSLVVADSAVAVYVVGIDFNKEVVKINMKNVMAAMNIVVTVLASSFHMYLKNKVMVGLIFGKFSTRFHRCLVIMLCYILLVVSFIYLISVHKDMTIYLFFVFGMALYLSNLMFCKKDDSRFNFSMRAILYDGLCMLILTIFSWKYPILRYQIAGKDQIIGVALIVSVVYGEAIALRIYQNIIKQNQVQQEQSQLMLQNVGARNNVQLMVNRALQRQAQRELQERQRQQRVNGSYQDIGDRKQESSRNKSTLLMREQIQDQQQLENKDTANVEGQDQQAHQSQPSIIV